MANLLTVQRRTSGIGLMGHVITDYPSPVAVRQMIEVMARAGAEVIEIQIPFSEPMADGPRFMRANHDAVARGVGVAAGLALMREVTRRYPKIHFVFMTYVNIVFRCGYSPFVAAAVDAGAQGVIIPDLPLEHATSLETEALAKGFTNMRLIAPNASDARLALLLKDATGMVYAVARAGVTGAVSDFSSVRRFVERIRAVRSDLAVAVGFGVKSPDDVRELKGSADLAVVGTASLQVFEEQGLTAYERFWQELAAATL